jgi:hypothetical protein
MSLRAFCAAACVLAAGVAAAAPLAFEDHVRLSDRIVIGEVQGAGSGVVRLSGGREVVLGTKDPSSGLVFTPYRIRVTECLFDKNGSCQAGDVEVLLPGGTIYETVDGAQRLRTWEIAGAAGAPLPPAGEGVLLFLTERNGRLFPLNDPRARVRVDLSSGSPLVSLRFSSPKLMTADALHLARPALNAGRPAATPPALVESVGIDRLKELIATVRQVPTPTSGMRHAVHDPVDARAACDLGRDSSRVRAGQDAHGGGSPLGVGVH